MLKKTLKAAANAARTALSTRPKFGRVVTVEYRVPYLMGQNLLLLQSRGPVTLQDMVDHAIKARYGNGMVLGMNDAAMLSLYNNVHIVRVS